MKDFSEFSAQLDEAAIPAENVNSRVEINHVPPNRRAGYTRFGGENIIGAVEFGTVSYARELIFDKSIAFDQKIGGSKVVARLVNSLTTWKAGHIGNATLVKFNLKTGAMWLAEDENDDGTIKWGKGFKFKKLYITNGDAAQKLGWIR